MAWNEPGGNKPRDPWQDGSDPPDLERALSRVKGFFEKFSPSNNGGSALLLIGALLVLWLAFTTFYTVQAGDKALVLRFGKFARVENEGLRMKWPSPIESVRIVEAAKVQQISEQGVRMLTRDENIVEVDYNVQYQINDAFKYAFKIRDPDETLKSASSGAVRQAIGNTQVEQALVERQAMEVQAVEILQETLNRYDAGIDVVGLNFPNIKAPAEVKEAFEDAITAREDKPRKENEARAYESKILPEAEGTAARMRAEAEGYRDSVIARAKGEAERFGSLVTEYKKAPEVTRRRIYLDTMQEVLKNNPKVVVDGNGSNVMYLPIEKLLQQTAPITGQQNAAGQQHTVLPMVNATAEPATPDHISRDRAGDRAADRTDRGGNR